MRNKFSKSFYVNIQVEKDFTFNTRKALVNVSKFDFYQYFWDSKLSENGFIA